MIEILKIYFCAFCGKKYNYLRRHLNPGPELDYQLSQLIIYPRLETVQFISLKTIAPGQALGT
jgi:hypothetical protein